MRVAKTLKLNESLLKSLISCSAYSSEAKKVSTFKVGKHFLTICEKYDDLTS